MRAMKLLFILDCPMSNIEHDGGSWPNVTLKHLKRHGAVTKREIESLKELGIIASKCPVPRSISTSFFSYMLDIRPYRRITKSLIVFLSERLNRFALLK